MKHHVSKESVYAPEADLTISNLSLQEESETKGY
jgi:hypothetical protein